MADTKTIVINGRHYDVHSGLPVEPPIKNVSLAKESTGTMATGIHTQLQRSKTLNRKIVQKSPTPTHAVTLRPTGGPKHMDISRSSSISRFAARPVVKPVTEDVMVTPLTHPMAQKAHQATAHKKQLAQPVHTPSSVLKNEAIAKAMNTPKKAQEKQSQKRGLGRFVSVGSASLAVLLLAGYLTYLNMPSISIRVAAVQSGINATYPDYQPNGYRLDGPIAYNDGEVNMKFVANAGPQSFNIREQRSSWNSSAVLENYVQPKAGKDYNTHTQSGLTIYTFDGQAAWVNGGILYTVDGNAPLSNDQILRIATSL